MKALIAMAALSFLVISCASKEEAHDHMEKKVEAVKEQQLSKLKKWKTEQKLKWLSLQVRTVWK